MLVCEGTAGARVQLVLEHSEFHFETARISATYDLNAFSGRKEDANSGKTNSHLWNASVSEFCTLLGTSIRAVYEPLFMDSLNPAEPITPHTLLLGTFTT